VAQIKITVPGMGDLLGARPIVILGPNGCGKTQLAKRIASTNTVAAVSAQRRTWLDDNLPVQTEQQLKSHVQNQQNHWQNHSWQPTEEINHVLSTLIQEHADALTRRNEEAIATGALLPPLTDGRLIKLQALWGRLFPLRKLRIGGFFPTVQRLGPDGAVEGTYQPKDMSDGERTILYMAARIITAEHLIILIDEPELHMHSRLAVLFWDEAEQLRPDCRFVYITHDLNFALSRRGATVLLAKSGNTAVHLSVDELPASIAPEVLGAATLPFYARRICLYEGETGKGFASQFLAAWFDGDETFAIGCGDRNAVCAAVTGLAKVGVSGATVVGLVDRDFYSDDVLDNLTAGVTVLPVHEIESVLCERQVVESMARHLGKDPGATWDEFQTRVQTTFTGAELSGVVARRVRARVNDLLDGAFSGAQILPSVSDTRQRHRERIDALSLPAKVESMFDQEDQRVRAALARDSHDMLAILPGKRLLGLLVDVLGLDGHADLMDLVVGALKRRDLSPDTTLPALGQAVEAALGTILPPRRCA
jgi:ABC-type cobalamin/Fe3+-siderophores transport system ATPase subunit